MAPSAISISENEVPVSVGKASKTSSNDDVYTTLNYLIPPGPDGLPVIEKGVPEEERRTTKREDIRDHKEVVIRDIRGREKDFKWDVQGFQYLQHEIPGVTNWFDPKQIKEIITPATIELAKKITGASEVIVYLDRNRNQVNQVGQSMSTATSPSHGVHTDVTLATCPYLLRQIIKDESEVQRLLKKHFIVFNIWRPIKTIRRDPLAVSDWTSIDAKNDIFNDRRIGADGIIEFGIPVYNENHKWYYLNGQRNDEPLLFKQLDSNEATQLTLPHSAFVDPKFADAAPRESIEMKMFGFFDDE